MKLPFFKDKEAEAIKEANEVFFTALYEKRREERLKAEDREYEEALKQAGTFRIRKRSTRYPDLPEEPVKEEFLLERAFMRAANSVYSFHIAIDWRKEGTYPTLEEAQKAKAKLNAVTTEEIVE